MNATRKKIEKLKDKIIELDEKMKEIALMKKDYQKQIAELEDEELFMFVKSLNMSVDTLSNDLAMGRLVRDYGLSKSDITELASEPSKKDGDMPIEKEDT